MQKFETYKYTLSAEFSDQKWSKLSSEKKHELTAISLHQGFAIVVKRPLNPGSQFYSLAFRQVNGLADEQRMFPGAEEIEPDYLQVCMLDDLCINAESAKEVVIYAASYQPEPKPDPSVEPPGFLADECNCQFHTHDDDDDQFTPTIYRAHNDDFRPAA